MTFNPIAALNVLETKHMISDKAPKAIDLGSQTASIDALFINNLIKKNKSLDNIQINNLNNLLNKKNFSTKDYFLSIGFKDYKSIDINGAYESYKFDLNKNILETYNYNQKYDLVINNGTGEHVFNQYTLFLNFHNLTKVNGIMLNILPFIDWINHGFYNFNPIFFADLAASNNYEIMKISLANRNGAELKLDDNNFEILFEQIKPYKNNSKFEKMVEIAKDKIGKNILLVVVTRKLSNDSFKTPLQGKYLGDVAEFKTEYKYQKGGSAKAENQIADNNKRK
ncbi:hypothetical protein OA855_03395 [Pelagibacteraceae bacterium]|nr:hypothetical protein [Pelagibacteraceae bacterium]